jgi:hypothetical protein
MLFMALGSLPFPLAFVVRIESVHLDRGVRRVPFSVKSL